MEERTYDVLFICQPDTPEEEIVKVISTLEASCAERGGKVDKVDRLGVRKLAYRVDKHREGAFVLMVVRTSRGDLVHELERRLKVADRVIKYITVRLDEQMKLQGKLVRRRERRAARRPRKQTTPAAAAPAAAAPQPAESAAS